MELPEQPGRAVKLGLLGPFHISRGDSELSVRGDKLRGLIS